MLYAIARFGSFGDEQENITAGWLILKGLVPYRDFFFHHAPLPFFIAGTAELVSAGRGLLVSRALVVFLHIASWLTILKLTHQKLRSSVYLFILTIPLISPLFHLQMLLADTLIVLAVSVVLFVCLSWWLYGTPAPSMVANIYFSTAFIAITSSIAAIFAFMTIGVFLAIKLIHSFGINASLRGLKQHIFWATFLASIFPFYFFVTQSIPDFFWSIITYNQQYYLPFRLAQNDFERSNGMLGRIFQQFYFFLNRSIASIFISSKTFATALAHTPQVAFVDSVQSIPAYLGVLVLEYFSTIAELETSLLLLLILVFILLQKVSLRWVVPTFLLIVLLRFRSNEIFHLGPFVISLIILSVVLLQQATIKLVWKTILLGMYIPFLFYTSKSYAAFLQKKPQYVAQSQIATSKKIMNCKKPSNSLLIIDGDTYLYYLTNSIPETKYFYYLPWFKPSVKINSGIESTIFSKDANRIFLPKVTKTDYRYFLLEKVKKSYRQVCPDIWLKKNTPF